MLVWILTRFLPADEPTLLLGVLLVLLTPCIDYVIVFTHLARGNAKLTLAATPLLFVAQVLLLPLYLWLLLPGSASTVVKAEPFLRAFLVLIGPASRGSGRHASMGQKRASRWRRST